MPIQTLEEIRLLSNLETHVHKLMQVLLFGQPELDKNLENRNIRQLKERITHSFNLRPLDREDTVAYIRHRLHAAGCPCPQVFTDGAEKLIAKASQGLTRRINILADKAMLAAYAESATTTRQRSLDHLLKPTVTIRHVKAAIKDSGYSMPLFSWFRPFGSAVAVIVICGGLALAQQENNASQATGIILESENHLSQLTAASWIQPHKQTPDQKIEAPMQQQNKVKGNLC